MPVIPEETIDHVLDRVNDVIDTVRILTQALNIVADHGKLLVSIHSAVTHKTGNDTLSELLAEIAETGRANHELLRKLLAKP